MKGPYYLPETADRDEQFLALCAPLSAGAGALAALIGGLTLIGWVGGVEALLWVPVGMVVMKANAALCFLLGGISLVILASGHKGRFAVLLSAFFALLVLQIAILTFLAYFVGWVPPFEELLARDYSAHLNFGTPGRMAPNETVAFLLLGSGLLLLSFRAGDWTVSVLAFLSGLVALHGMMGFAYASESRHEFFNDTHIAFPTALAMMALSVGSLLALGDRGMMAPLSRRTVGAIQARRMLPSMMVVPFLLAWLRHEGMQRDFFADEFGVALMVVASSAALAVVVWIGLLTINRSDLARSRTLESLRSEQRFRRAMEESILTGIVATDTGRRITYVNPAFCRLVGMGEKALIGSSPPYPFVHPEERRAVFDFDSAAASGHGHRQEFEFLLLGGDGKAVDVSAFLSPLRDANGDVIGALAAVTDITEKKRQERERIRAEASMKEMEQAMVQQGKMAVLGQMAAGIAHEIRNPLSGLNLYLASAEKLAADAEFPDPDNLATLMKSLATARAASIKIEGVIRRVMDFVKPAPSRLLPVRINEVISEALELVATTGRKAGVTISASLSDEVPECRADARLIEQLVLNLVTNAIQALEKGEGEKRVEIATGTDAGQVVIRVGDSGPGVRSEDRDRIFDPFFTTKATGTGLGLSISSRIVAEHGGAIDVGRSPLGGAEFRVSLPALALPSS